VLRPELRREEYRRQREAEYLDSLEVRLRIPAPFFSELIFLSVVAAGLLTLSDLPEFVWIAPMLAPICAFCFR